jgi:hypothetical protein
MNVCGVGYSIHGKFVSYLFSKQNWALQPVKMGKILSNKRCDTKHSKSRCLCSIEFYVSAIKLFIRDKERDMCNGI